MKKILLFLVSIFVFSFFTQPAFSADRFAACDLCGLCQVDKVIQSKPQNWESCRKCLYPDANADPNSMDTLKIDTSTNIGPTPHEGRQYTMIGCIKTDLGSFSEEGAAAGVVQTLLNVLFAVIGGIAFLYLVYGSFIVLTSQAAPERLNYGKRLIYGAIIGVVFTLTSAFIVNFVASGILKLPGF